MKKILFLVRSLNAGGAERQLLVTAKGLSERQYQVTVLTFYSGGFYFNELNNSKVQLLNLRKKGRWDLILFILRLRRVLCQQEPDVIYSFMGTSNILSVLLHSFTPATRVIWGVRASNMDLEKYDWLTSWSYWFECRLARFSNLIISNSNAGLEYAVDHGFPREKMLVIPNGIDTERFKPDRSAGKELRKQWGVTEDEVLIGLVGRIDPMKGHPIFLDAAALLKKENSNVRFVCVGVGDVIYERAMRQLATDLGLDDVLIWAGRHADMFAVYNALNISSSSSSYGEGFSNVIGEAMACGKPCVTTDVGDSALIVGKTGIVLPVNDSKTLSKALNKLLLLDNKSLKSMSIMARFRIVEKFSVAALLDSTEKIL
jgi:glycosyltransferase involved in cell wall biosynthesis